ncbi:hypothetical protein N7495_002635 [Penicillium taxi]|uniref:uncharacterized protein n=1 Tax=Penicillium taxi TaxID=168475 RepID=UPI0025450EE8|nr:uncharacterized protein N7495_002635 [Penicillium taxi]KAJ5902107.1 hypothetical protein N7495_002635 [Penicillium taxi]
MPAPLAKGIIVTVSVLVAAGIAVYQSPQFQEWMNNSRRKVAVALHKMGDEIHPRGSASPEDISMREEVGEAAQERRRIARAEIDRRASYLESLRNGRDTSQPLNSFDTLVDNEGNLRMSQNNENQRNIDLVAISTSVDMGAPQPVRRGAKPDWVDSMEGNRLQLEIPSVATPNRSSDPTAEFTPKTEVTSGDPFFDPFSDSPIREQTPVSASSHTLDNESSYEYPHSASNSSQHPDLLDDLDEFSHGNQFQHEVSSAASTGGFSHIYDFNDTSSDGTMSDLGAHSDGGIATPAWSEVGSVISDNDAGHHQL